MVLYLHTLSIQKTDINVKINDQEGNTIYSKTFKSAEANRAKKFNLAQVEPGTYEVSISDNFGTTRQSVTKLTSGLLVNDGVKVFIQPQFILKGRHLGVNYLNLNNLSTLRILDPNNNLLYSSEVTIPNYSKQFDLSKLIAGEYTVAIDHDGESFQKTIILN